MTAAPGGPRPLVKVCGVTRPLDAERAVRLGADLLGLNFHPPSPRALDPEVDRARVHEIVAAAAGAAGAAEADGERRPLLAGVFVHREPAEIVELVDAFGLDLVQVHRDPAPDGLGRFGGRAIRVFRRAEGRGLEAAGAEIAAGAPAWGYLFDTPPRRRGGSADPYGGTGESWDHGAIRSATRRGAGGRPVLVAGGIGPGRARAALEASGADGIDVCSGIESAPGIKDADAMERLFEEIRHARPAP